MNRWKRISRIVTTTAAVSLVLLIAGILFFNLAPGFGFYIVQTGSMEPSISPGDLIFTTPAGETVEPGQIITFKTGNQATVTHRAVSLENGLIQTKGDANEDPDIAMISPSLVQGVYLFKIPYIGRITDLLHTKMGWFMIVLLPSFLLVMWILVEIAREILKKPGTKNPATGGNNGPAPMSAPKNRVETAQEYRGLLSHNGFEVIRKELNNVLKDVYYSK